MTTNGGPYSLSGRASLVTGASSGLGRHFALTLARSGAKVALAARRTDSLEEVRGAIIEAGGTAAAVKLDVTDAASVKRAVAEAAVVARPDEKWGETPCAFVALKSDAENPSAEEIIEWCRQHMARYKVPKTIIFGELPKTSTGKIQKNVLRDRVRAK